MTKTTPVRTRRGGAAAPGVADELAERRKKPALIAT